MDHLTEKHIIFDPGTDLAKRSLLAFYRAYFSEYQAKITNGSINLNYKKYRVRVLKGRYGIQYVPTYKAPKKMPKIVDEKKYLVFVLKYGPLY